MNKQIQCYLGVDWGRQCHQACVVNVAGEVLGNQSFVHSGEGMGQLVQWCRRLGGDEAQFAAAIETPHGPVVETLLALDFAVHAINPKQLSRFRDRHSPSGAKDDRRDARVLADALRTDPQAFRRLQPADKFTVQLRHRLRSYENLVEQRTRLNNQIQELLSSYYPQFLKVSRNLSLRWVLVLWKKLPTPQKAKRVRVPTVERLLRKHGAKKKTAQELLEMLTQPALNRSDDCIAATVSEIRILVEILEVIQKNRNYSPPLNES